MRNTSVKKIVLVIVLAASVSSFLFLQERSQFLNEAFSVRTECPEEKEWRAEEAALPSIVLIQKAAQLGKRLLSVRF